MITINDTDYEKKNYILVGVIVFFAVIIIAAIVVIFYWTITDTFPQLIKNYLLPEAIEINLQPKPPAVKIGKTENKLETKVIKYIFPATLPEDIRSGNCFEKSIAQPYRQDAFRCTVNSSIYDPCFANDKKDKIVCQMNPLIDNVFTINFSQPLPIVGIIKNLQNNWAWFIELEDGTICSPYTGTKPIIDKETATYGCKPKVKGNLDVLVGDLSVGKIWTAKRIIVVRDNVGTGWNTQFSGIVNIKTIWQ